MTTEQTDPPQWGAPPPPPPARPSWSVKRIVIAVAVAVGIAAAGGVAIYAASGSTDDARDPGGGRVMGGGPVLMGGPKGGGLPHGEFQSGEVTELTADKITARSSDGYTKTYVIDDGTEIMDGVEKGDDVTIIATTDGGTATAKTVMEEGVMPKRLDDRN